MATSFIQIRDFKPNKKAYPKKLRMNPKIIPSIFVYDVFEMFTTFVKLHLTNVEECFKNYTESFSTVIGCPYE